MRNSSLWILLLIAVVFIATSALWVGCGDDDDDDSDDPDPDDDDDDTGPSQGEKGSLNGCVHDFLTKQPVQGATVKLLDDTTGDELGIEKVSPSGDGCITFEIPEGVDQVGVLVTRDGYYDTLQYHFDNGLTGEEFLFVSDSTASLIELALGMNMDPTKGHAAGGLYYGNPTDENPIGCNVVSFDPGDGDTHYMGFDDIPNVDRDTTDDPNTSSGKGVNPGNGYFVSVNETSNIQVTISATVGVNNPLTKTTVIPNLPADSIAIANIYFDPEKDTAVEEDPEDYQTPDWCID